MVTLSQTPCCAMSSVSSPHTHWSPLISNSGSRACVCVCVFACLCVCVCVCLCARHVRASSVKTLVEAEIVTEKQESLRSKSEAHLSYSLSDWMSTCLVHTHMCVHAQIDRHTCAHRHAITKSAIYATMKTRYTNTMISA